MKEKWDKYRCECGRGFAVEQISGDELEEPACPECGETSSELISEPSARAQDWEAAARELMEWLEGIEPHPYSQRTKAFKLIYSAGEEV